jgi:hypothetical protein
MIELNDPSDVLSPNIQIEKVSTIEFEFDTFVLRRELHHWEIQFEDEEGEQGIVIEREDFIDGKFKFKIEGSEHELLLEDFDRIDKFYHEKIHSINPI